MIFQPQVPIAAKVREPEAIGFTRGELATMYKSALEKGSTISLSSLTNALSTGEVPQVTQTHVEFPIRQPLYQYYFFPLKTFMSEFKKDHGYKTIVSKRSMRFNSASNKNSTNCKRNHKITFYVLF